jgi:predicted O-linked N-acetylglucosamine transferase (SPINDLY family)
VITTEALPDLQPSAPPMISRVFNRIDKISDGALEVWSKLLREVPGSAIVIKNAALNDPFLRDGLIGRFAAHGISQNRIIVVRSVIVASLSCCRAARSAAA